MSRPSHHAHQVRRWRRLFVALCARWRAYPRRFAVHYGLQSHHTFHHIPPGVTQGAIRLLIVVTGRLAAGGGLHAWCYAGGWAAAAVTRRRGAYVGCGGAPRMETLLVVSRSTTSGWAWRQVACAKVAEGAAAPGAYGLRHTAAGAGGRYAAKVWLPYCFQRW